MLQGFLLFIYGRHVSVIKAAASILPFAAIMIAGAAFSGWLFAAAWSASAVVVVTLLVVVDRMRARPADNLEAFGPPPVAWGPGPSDLGGRPRRVRDFVRH